jgi:hypothetical protein
MKRTMKRAAILVVAGAASVASVAAAATIENGVAGLKLIMLDKYGLGKAKVVYVAKGSSGITKPGGDVANLSGTVEVFPLSDPSNKAVYDLNGWLVNKDTVAKYVNKTAGPGDLGAKVVVIKPELVGKLVAKNLGDGDSDSGDQSATDLDLQALTDGDTIRVIVTTTNGDDTNIFCSDFSGLAIKKDNTDANFKVLSKSSTAPGSCAVGATTTTTTTPSTTTTTVYGSPSRAFLAHGDLLD